MALAQPSKGYRRSVAAKAGRPSAFPVIRLASDPTHFKEGTTGSCPLTRNCGKRSTTTTRPIGATVISRASVRPYTAELTTLHERLADLRQPVSPTGMLLVRDLLTSPTGPLYEAARAAEIPATIDNILRTLDFTDHPA